MVSSFSPILVAADVLETVRFYTEVLGFPSSWTWGDPPTVGGAAWAKASVMFSFRPEFVGRVETLEQWIEVEEVDALHARHLERGAMIVSPIEDKPWGWREYTVRDINGYHLRFVGQPSYTSRGSGALPEDVEIVRRIPTDEEFQRVAGKALYNDGVPTGILERAWGGVVARNQGGEAIGTTRIVRDAPGWFSIWDVAVLPDWQGRRIGAAMMEAALEMVREESPGAFVYLFTFKPAFYERLGFEKKSVHMRRV